MAKRLAWATAPRSSVPVSASDACARARREADLLAQEMDEQEKRLAELERPGLRDVLLGRLRR